MKNLVYGAFTLLTVFSIWLLVNSFNQLKDNQKDHAAAIESVAKYFNEEDPTLNAQWVTRVQQTTHQDTRTSSNVSMVPTGWGMVMVPSSDTDIVDEGPMVDFFQTDDYIVGLYQIDAASSQIELDVIHNDVVVSDPTYPKFEHFTQEERESWREDFMERTNLEQRFETIVWGDMTTYMR